jgi:hypothetical protein
MSAALTRSVAKALVSLACLLAVAGCKAHPVTLTMGRDEIQRRLEAKFPVEQQVFVSTVTLEQPRVILREGSDRIGIDLRIRVRAPLLPEYGGQVAVTGKLVYRREETAFFLREPVLEDLVIDGLRAEHAELVRKPAETAASAALETIPVYRLEGRDLEEVGARSLLETVVVRDGKLCATLAIP